MISRRFTIPILTLLVSIPIISFPMNRSEVLSHFNHDIHNRKVFEPKKIECDTCHTFKLDRQSMRAIPLEGFKKSAFKRDFKSICHDCHQNSSKSNIGAPQTCFTCHQTVENAHEIKPQNHMNISWKTSHATNARIDGDGCLQCHMTSECAKCHLRRNDVEMNNHTRNFRFMHSIEARAQPHTCDSCHSKSFCEDCHLGKK